MGDHETYMHHAIEQALKAEGFTSPNPLVGCVLVKDGKIIAEGFHRGPGNSHAEADALTKAGSNAKGATAYVTLEPCNHYGNTPPCAKALIDAEIAEVYYAVTDPNPLAEGGAQTLRDAGIKVHSGLLEQQAGHLIRFWLHHQKTKLPFVVAKYAASLDGKIATHTGDSKWITSTEAREKAHTLRQICDAIIVGVDTIIADDPSLTSRSSQYEQHRHPLRVILDSNARTPLDAKILSPDLEGTTVIATTDAAPAPAVAALREVSDVITLPSEKGRVSLPALLKELGERGILSCMVEGGAQVLGGFFDDQLVQEVWAFIAPKFIGGDGPSPIAGNGIEEIAHARKLENIDIELLGDNFLIRGQMNENSKEAECSQA